ncbi:hypothetical protein HYY75_03515, partial [bacterium]|nr:hypothetical protein [bacterium]
MNLREFKKLLFPKSFSSSKGFILFIVITVLIMIGIMALSFAFQKSGEIEQLSKNIDQNRLMVFSQSANNEMFAYFKRFANVNGALSGQKDPKLLFKQALANGYPQNPIAMLNPAPYSPPITREIAKTLPSYKIQVSSKANLVITGEFGAPRKRSLTGYLEVISHSQDDFKNKIEIVERRDVKLVDLEDFFDKYVLYVKNFCYDYNNPKRRLVIIGRPINDANTSFSRVYLGNRYYPNCKEKELFVAAGKADLLPLFFDLVFEGGGTSDPSIINLPNFLFGGDKTFKDFELTTLTTSKPNEIQEILATKEKMKNLGKQQIFKKNFSVKFDSEYKSSFMKTYIENNPAVKKQYMLVVKSAQEVVSNNQAKSTMALDNSAANEILNDYAKRSGDNYSACQIFQGIVTTFIKNWFYRYGYTDASHIWDDDKNLKQFAGTSEISIFSGITSYAKIVDYNPERFGVGKMAFLFGPQNDRPVFVEGMAFSRFFKISFFDDFLTTLDLLNNKIDNFYVSPVPLSFISPFPPTVSFFNDPKIEIDPMGKTNSQERLQPVGRLNPAIDSLRMENSLMSRPIDHIPLNRLLNKNSVGIQKLFFELKDKNGVNTTFYYSPFEDKLSTSPLATSAVVYPMQKAYLENDPLVSGDKFIKGSDFFPLIDYETFSHNYKTAETLTAEQVVGEVLYVDGKMYVEKGKLDLTKVKKFTGNGMIYLANGNCYLGSLEKVNDTDSLRIFLSGGSFKVESPKPDVFIQASLIALNFSSGDSS